MIERINLIFLHFNWTIENIVLMLIGILLVEAFRISGRSAAPTSPRTKFVLRYWLSQTNNWLSPLITVACAFTALALKDALCPPGLHPLLYAFGAGAMGQAIIKIGLKGIRGAMGLNGTAE